MRHFSNFCGRRSPEKLENFQRLLREIHRRRTPQVARRPLRRRPWPIQDVTKAGLEFGCVGCPILAVFARVGLLTCPWNWPPNGTKGSDLTITEYRFLRARAPQPRTPPLSAGADKNGAPKSRIITPCGLKEMVLSLRVISSARKTYKAEPPAPHPTSCSDIRASSSVSRSWCLATAQLERVTFLKQAPFRARNLAEIEKMRSLCHPMECPLQPYGEIRRT